ncbi:MAG: YbjN domain-containing protein, partial [Caulobacterales bacterium]|nr:YbjN domain-containing protein [Caulobacterales bacterium]
SDGAETLHLCLGLDAKAPPEQRVRLRELLALLNERMWLGHFDLWAEDGAIVYRSALPLPGGAEPTQAQIATMIAAALEAGERFYPSYNLLMWGGKGAVDAVAAAMFDTVGEA